MSLYSRLEVKSDGADDMGCGKASQTHAVPMEYAWLLSAEQRVAGMISCDLAVEDSILMLLNSSLTVFLYQEHCCE